MKTKKILALCVSLGFVFSFVIPYGCTKNKNETEPVPAKKKSAWAVGVKDSTNYGMILFTKDGGDTWQRQGEGSSALLGIDLTDVWAVDENTVWVVGSDNSIVKTTDGGVTWVRIPAPLNRPDINLLSISLSGAADIWISGVPGIVYNSKNKGITWTVSDTNVFQHCLLQGIHAINSQTVYVAGGTGTKSMRGFIARTTNGGQTWDSVVPEHDYNRNEWISVKSSDPDHIVVFGVKSHYVSSSDAGNSWKNDSVPGTGGIGGADINSLTMLDAQTWWGAFDYEGIFITKNSGASWTKQTGAGPGAMFLFGIDYYDKDLAVIVAMSSVSANGKILKTANGGALWELKHLSRSWLNKVSFIKN